MKLSDYIDALSNLKRDFSTKGATSEIINSGWAAFLVATNEDRGVEIYSGNDQEEWTVDYFQSEVSIDGERDFDTFPLAVTSAFKFLFEATLPKSK